MSALFNQTNISPGTAFASGGSGGGVSQIIAGSNITLSPSGGTGVVTITAAAGGGSNFPTGITIGTTAINPVAGGGVEATEQVRVGEKEGATGATLINFQDIAFIQAGTISTYTFATLNNTTNGIDLTNISTVNGTTYPPTSSSFPLTILIHPETNSATTLVSGDNYLSSLFSSPANLDANSVYRLTFKGTLSWEDTPTPSDWAQLYVQLASGMPPDDTRITPIMPYLVYANGGNTSQSVYLETLLRSTDATTLDWILSLNNAGAALYTLRLTWFSLQKIGAYT